MEGTHIDQCKMSIAVLTECILLQWLEVIRIHAVGTHLDPGAYPPIPQLSGMIIISNKTKIKTIEYLDQRAVKYIVQETEKMNEDIAIALLPDHATPCAVRTHTHDPIPFIIYKPGESPDSIKKYDEESMKNGGYGLIKGQEFIKLFLGR